MTDGVMDQNLMTVGQVNELAANADKLIGIIQNIKKVSHEKRQSDRRKFLPTTASAQRHFKMNPNPSALSR